MFKPFSASDYRNGRVTLDRHFRLVFTRHQADRLGVTSRTHFLFGRSEVGELILVKTTERTSDTFPVRTLDPAHLCIHTEALFPAINDTFGYDLSHLPMHLALVRTSLQCNGVAYILKQP